MHIDGLVRFVAAELSECSGRPMHDCINDARVAVAAVRRFDLAHRPMPLNARAFAPIEPPRCVVPQDNVVAFSQAGDPASVNPTK